MTKKIAIIGVCGFALMLNVGCSSTKSTAKNTSAVSGSDKTVNAPATLSDNNEKLPPVAEAPRRSTWGSNISPYFN